MVRFSVGKFMKRKKQLKEQTLDKQSSMVEQVREAEALEKDLEKKRNEVRAKAAKLMRLDEKV